MRTTIRLDDPLLRRAKAQAAASGRSLNDFIADAVRAAVVPRGRAVERLPIPTFSGRGLRPGVDLDDTASLLDVMNREVVYSTAVERPRRVAESRGGRAPGEST
jgi:hypothetical protein